MGESRALTVWVEPVEEEGEAPVETRFLAALVVVTRVATIVGLVWGRGSSVRVWHASCPRVAGVAVGVRKVPCPPIGEALGAGLPSRQDWPHSRHVRHNGLEGGDEGLRSRDPLESPRPADRYSG